MIRDLLLLLAASIGAVACLSSDTTAPDAPVIDCPPVTASCGPRPVRPSSSSPEFEQWAHDIDIWAKCAENAQ